MRTRTLILQWAEGWGDRIVLLYETKRKRKELGAVEVGISIINTQVMKMARPVINNLI